jgi:hypothetical protein
MILRALSFIGLMAFTVSTCVAQEGVKDLFNGKDLTGWKGNTKLWSVENGAIVGRTSAEKPLQKNTFLVWDGEVSDFELDFDYRIEGGNSGVQYRSKLIDADEFIVGGYQADIDATLNFAGINYEEKGRGILAKRGKRATVDAEGKITEEEFAKDEDLKKVIKTDDWNHYRVVAKGNKLSHFINGTLMSETIDNQKSKAATKGILALQIHTGPPMTVQFKNLRLK